MDSEWREAVRRRLDHLQLTATRRAEIPEELAEHLQDRVEELRAGGASERHAQRTALAELDDRDLVAGIARVETTMPDAVPLGGGSRSTPMAGFAQDLQFGARLLIKDWGASLVIVL